MRGVDRKKQPDASHTMSEWGTEVRAPAGTPRFYSVRTCQKCEAEEIAHPAGHFMDEDLLRKCLITEEKNEQS